MRKRNLENRGTRRRRNKEREKPWEMEKTGEEKSRRWVNKEKKKTGEGENRKRRNNEKDEPGKEVNRRRRKQEKDKSENPRNRFLQYRINVFNISKLFSYITLLPSQTRTMLGFCN